VTTIGCVYIAVGAIGFAYHAPEFIRQPFLYDIIWIEMLRLLAVAAGVYMLLGHNWARWVALAWMGCHVILSAFNGIAQVAMHALFFAILTYFLTRSTASRYFRTAGT
jgi:hypothetical protein